MNHILTVDPGVYTMGACLWDEGEFYSSHVAMPKKRLCIDIAKKERKYLGAKGGVDYCINWITTWFEALELTECYCEKPSVWSNAKGYAASIQGHVLNMEHFRGRLYQVCQTYNCKFHDVPVTEWKGNLSKQLTVERIKQIMFENDGKLKATILTRQGSHDWDAAGIGFFLQGVF